MPRVRLSDWTVRQTASPLLPSPGPSMGSPSQVSTQPTCKHTHTSTGSLEQCTCTDSVYLSTDIDEDPRLTVIPTSLILHDVTFEDTAIYQCQGSNKHGTILTNTNVYVIGECLCVRATGLTVCVCVCLRMWLISFLCVLFQSCHHRSLLTMGAHTHLQRASRLCWSVTPLVLLNLKLYGEAQQSDLYIK